MMGAALAVAENTILEAVREKVLYLIGGFAAFTVVASRILSPLALGEGRRITCDLGILGLSLSGVLIIIFVGHSLIYREIERGTVSFLFSRPVGRGAFVLGKFLGLAGVLAAAVAAMGGILGAVLWASGFSPGPELAASLVLALLRLWILAACAILLASVASPVPAGLFVLALWIIGNCSGSLIDLAAMHPNPAARAGAEAVLWILPRLDLYEPARWLVHRGSIPAERWLWSVSYAALYCAGMLLAARTAFARRALLG